MICYKDRTFCDSDCTRSDCYRHLSEADSRKAQELNLPVSWSDCKTGCPYYTKPQTP